MKVLDLFAGTGSATQAFLDRGHDVRTLELADFPNTTYQMDIRQFAKSPRRTMGSWRPDIIWASPPCTAFSFANGGEGMGHVDWDMSLQKHPTLEWQFFGPRKPMTKKSREGCALVLAAIRAISILQPRYYWIENPVGGLSTLAFMRAMPKTYVTYCQYGDTRMKRTQLWGTWPATWEPKPPCYNGEPCHEAASRGDRTGTAGLKDHVERSRVPYGLSLEIAIACEQALALC